MRSIRSHYHEHLYVHIIKGIRMNVQRFEDKGPVWLCCDIKHAPVAAVPGRKCCDHLLLILCNVWWDVDSRFWSRFRGWHNYRFIIQLAIK